GGWFLSFRSGWFWSCQTHFNDGVGVDAAIDEYKRLFFIAGLDFKLTELNRNIGSQTAFEYNRYN
ncbi:MAG TPA: hypothetical protein P5315_08470, partial [Clostridia bacterium]|nr:hypothetical protein [Clostridia bacterium]